MALENSLTAANQAATTPHQPATASQPKRSPLLPLLAALLIILTITLGLLQNRPPAVVPASAPPTQFSAERALRDLRVIAAKPHPTGSAENAAVREYLVQQIRSLGLEPKVTADMGVRSFRRATASFLQNVVTRLPGTDPAHKAVLVMAHYDSVASAPGASDDGAAIAAMLETMRGLLAGPRLRNDVIFAMTDSEEFGTEGAAAFLSHDPWVKDVAVVLNFEARGSSGPSTMFQASDGSEWLIREFARAAKSPVVSSLAPAIYKYMPNDTDLTNFLQRGYAGLNFAYGSGYADYHTRNDSVENLDPRSLQHHGEYMSSLTRHLGTIALDQPHPTAEAIYFNLFGTTVLYSQAWGMALTGLAAVLFLLTCYLGRRRGRIALRSMFAGAGTLVLAMLAAAGVASGIWFGLQALRHGLLTTDEGGAPHGELYILGFLLLTTAITVALLGRSRRRIGTDNLTMGVLLVYLLLAAASVIGLPGASHLFLWPLLFGILARTITFLAPRPEAIALRLASLVLVAMPLILLTASLGMTANWNPLSFVGLTMVFVVLALATLEPFLALVPTGRTTWRLPITLPATTAAVGLGLVLTVGLLVGFTPRHPMPSTLVYVHNADTGISTWATMDYEVFDWNHAALPDATAGRQDELLPYQRFEGTTTWKHEAAAAPVTVPALQVQSDQTQGGQRTLQLHLTAQPGAFVIVRLRSAQELTGVAVDGQALAPQLARAGLRVVNMPPGGVPITLQVQGAGPLEIALGSMVPGVPDLPGAAPVQRPDWVMAGWEWDLSTFATKTIHIPGA